jgi:hypothetical protein
MTCDLLFTDKGHNLPGFMIGRQLCVASCMFFVARVTTVNIGEGEENIFGVSDGLQAFFNTGLCGAIIITIVGSISWQLVASAFPIAFLSNPFTYIFLRICLFLEATGIASGAWVLDAIQKRICGFQRDEEYIGTSEERGAAKKMSDNVDKLHLGQGHLLKLSGFAEHAPASLKKLWEADASVAEYLKSIHAMENGKPTKITAPIKENTEVELTKLRVLWLRLVGLQSIPATIGSLRNLSDLMLGSCRSLESQFSTLHSNVYIFLTCQKKPGLRTFLFQDAICKSLWST